MLWDYCIHDTNTLRAGQVIDSRIPEAASGARLPLEQQLRVSASAIRNPVPPQLLRKYIAYTQLYAAPVLSAEAKEARLTHPMHSSLSRLDTVRSTMPATSCNEMVACGTSVTQRCARCHTFKAEIIAVCSAVRCRPATAPRACLCNAGFK